MDFRKSREKIESIISQARELVNKESFLESSQALNQAQNLLTELKNIAQNDIQEKSILRLGFELEIMAENIDNILSKKDAGKKGDGNVAFKLNWNDKHYKAACSQKAYEFNIEQGRAWCNLPECKCREFSGELTLTDHPCYESIALKELFFAAGWDNTEERKRPRRIHHVRQGKMAILTTRPPGYEEKDRLIIACIYIEKVQDDPETKIYGDKEKSIEVDYDKIKIKFWEYYKNAGAEGLALWASGLFRYVTDNTVLGILNGIGEEYKNNGYSTEKVIELIKYYENIIKKKGK